MRKKIPQFPSSFKFSRLITATQTISLVHELHGLESSAFIEEASIKFVTRKLSCFSQFFVL